LSRNDYQEKILHIVQEAKEPIDPENVRVLAKIGNWQTALKHLLQLMIEGKIEGQKTSKSWVFWSKNAREITINE